MSAKRWICCLLAAAMLAALAAGCGETKKTDAPAVTGESGSAAPAAPETDPPETEAPGPDGLYPADFEGAVYTVVAYSQMAEGINAEELNGDNVNDERYYSCRRVEERFSVTLATEIQDIEPIQVMSEIVLSGDGTKAIFLPKSGLKSLVMDGLLYNLFRVEQFDLDQPWWGNHDTEAVTIGKDKAYLGFSFLTWLRYAHAYALIINKPMAEKYNLTIPYQDVYDGTWTLDKYIAMCAAATADTNGNGKMDKSDDWGLTFEYNRYSPFQKSCLHYVEKDENNMPYLAIDVDRAQTYLKKMETLIDNYAWVGGGSFGLDKFVDGEALFCYLYLRAVSSTVRNSQVQYGFLVPPKFDEDQEEYVTYAGGDAWGIPRTSAEQIDMIGTVTEALSYEMYTNVVPSFIETTMKGKLSDAPEDSRVLSMIPQISRVFFEAYLFGIGGGLANLVENHSSSQLASTFASERERIEQTLADLLEKFEKLEP